MNSLKCPACGAYTPATLRAPKAFGCMQCGAVYHISDNGTYTREKGLQKIQFQADPDWVVPGAQIEYRGQCFTVQAIYAYRTAWEEWDNEDKKWETGTDDYLECFLTDELGNELFLERNDGYPAFFIRSEIPVAPDFLEKLKNEKNVIERGIWKLSAFEGADDEPLDRSEWKYTVVSHSAGDVTLEWQTSGEYKAFRHQGVTVTELEQWRVRTPQAMDTAGVRSRHLNFYRLLFGFTTLIMFLMIMATWIGGERAAVDDFWSFSTPFGGVTMIDTQRQTHTIPVVHLEADKAYSFDLKCQLESSNSDVDFSIYVVRNSDGKVINTIEASFYTESGRDSDGDWTEAVLSDHFYFKSETAGDYSIVMHVLPKAEGQTGGSGILHLRIYPVMLARYFIVPFLLVALFWLILQWEWEYQSVVAKKDINPWLREFFKP